MEIVTQGAAPPETARAPAVRPPATRTAADPVEGPVEPTKPRTAAQRAVPFPIVPVAIAATLILAGLALGLAAWLGWKWAALLVGGLIAALWLLRLALRAAWLKKIGRGRTGARSGPTSGGRGGVASRLLGGRSPRSAASRSGGTAGGRGGILGRRSGLRAGGSAAGRSGGILGGLAGGRRRSAAGGTAGTKAGTSGTGAGGSAGGGWWPFGRGRSGGRTGRRGGLFGGSGGGSSTGRGGGRAGGGRGRPSGDPRTPATSGVRPGRTAGPSVASGTLDEVKAGLGKLRDWLDRTEWDGFSVGGRRDRPEETEQTPDTKVPAASGGGAMRSGSTANAGETSLYGFVEKVLPEMPKVINDFAAEIQRVADASRDDQVVSAALTERIEAAVKMIKAVAVDAEGWRGQARREQEADIDRVERPRKSATTEGRADSQRGRQDM